MRRADERIRVTPPYRATVRRRIYRLAPALLLVSLLPCCMTSRLQPVEQQAGLVLSPRTPGYGCWCANTHDGER